MKIKQVSYLQSIDFVRGYAALAVVFHHASEGAAFSSNNPAIQLLNHIFSYGSLGVPVFFVISGFCIHRRKAEQFYNGLDESISFKKYWNRRFFRLYPSYFVVCVLSACLLLVAQLAGGSSVTIASYPGNPYLFIVFDLLAHMLMIHCFFSWSDFGLGNGPLWTIAREEQYYLLYFPLLQLRKRFSIWSCLVLAVFASYVTIQVGLSINSYNPNTAKMLVASSFSFWPQWVLGMLSVEIIIGLSLSRKLFNYRILILAGLFIAVFQNEYGFSDIFFKNLILGLASFIVITTLTTLEIEGRWLNNALARFGLVLGQYSYSLYLVHAPTVIVLSKFARYLGANKSVSLYIISTFCMVIICQVPAKILYLLVERHGQTRKNPS